MPARKAKRRITKPPTAKQLAARAKFVKMVRAKAAKKKRATAPAERKMATVRKNVKNVAKRRPKYKTGQLVYSYQNKDYKARIIRIHDDGEGFDYKYKLRLKSGSGTTDSNWINESSLSRTKQNPARRRNRTIIKRAKKVIVLNLGKTTRRKYRNGYLDLVIMGQAKKTPSGWLLGGKPFPFGRGIVPASKRGYYLDKATGTVFSKKARNVAQGFFDGSGAFHPIRSSSDCSEDRVGHHTRSKKRKASTKKASQSARFKAETRRRKTTTSRLASRSLRGSSGILKRGKRNPSVKEIRQTFAGRTGKQLQGFAPTGTPKNVAKLGTLKLIDTETAKITPRGTVYLCADTRGKLHICGSKDAPLVDGPARSFGKIRLIEYDESKPHLYPNQGTIRFYHKMGEESGNRPTLYADGKGGLKIKGGSYRLTREGIVD